MDTKPNQSFVARQLFSPDSFGRKLSATSSSSQSQSPFESHDNHTTTENKPQSDSPAASKAKASKSHDDHVTSKERSHDDHMTSKEGLQHPPQVQSDPFLRDQDVPAVGRVTPANDISLTFSGWMPRRGDLPRPSSPTAINRVFKVVFIGTPPLSSAHVVHIYLEVIFVVLLLQSGRCYEAEICAILLPLRCSFRWYNVLLKSNFSVFDQKPWTIIRRFDQN